MKITMNELQAKKVLELLARSDNVLADQDLVDVFGRVKAGLDRAAGNPQLTADELGAVADLVDRWLLDMPAITLPAYAENLKKAATTALPKLKTMARRAAALEDLRRRTPGMDVDPDLVP